MTNSYLNPLLSIQPAPPQDGRSKVSSSDSAFQDQFAAADPMGRSDPAVPRPTTDPNSKPASAGETKPLSDEKNDRGDQPEGSTTESEKPNGERISENSRSADEGTADRPDEANPDDDRAVDENDASAKEATAIGTGPTAHVERAAETLEGAGQSSPGNQTALDPSNDNADLREVKSTAPDSAAVGERIRSVDPAISADTEANGTPTGEEDSKGTEREVPTDLARDEIAKRTATTLATEQTSTESVVTEPLSADASEVALPKKAGAEDATHESNPAATQANAIMNNEIGKTESGDAVAGTGTARGQQVPTEDISNEQAPQGDRRAVSRRDPRRVADGERLDAVGTVKDGDAIKPAAPRQFEPVGSDAKFSADSQQSAADNDLARSDDGQGRSQAAAGRALATPLAGHNFRASGRSTNTADGGEGGRLRVDPARFVSRVAKAFRLAEDRGGQLRLRLSPPELGSIRLEVTVKQGAVTATIETETIAARRVLLDNLPLLRDRLAEQNLRIDQFDVDVRDDGAGSRYDQATSGGDQRDNAGRPEPRPGGDDTRNGAAATDSVPRTVSLRGDETLNVVA